MKQTTMVVKMSSLMIKDGDTLSIMTNMFAMVIFKRLLLSKVDSKKKIVIIERQINFVVTA